MKEGNLERGEADGIMQALVVDNEQQSGPSHGGASSKVTEPSVANERPQEEKSVT